ncbi:MAG: hypothetical protein MJ211_10265 [Bacteroidales bacterium]|nr:hypothetical protein [Bacteroidales bacterium]
MALQLKLNETINTKSRSYTVVGISHNIYKDKDDISSYIEYTVKSEGKYYYIDDYLTSDKIVFYYETKDNINYYYYRFLLNLEKITIITQDIYVNKTIGDTLWCEGDNVKCKQYFITPCYLAQKNNKFFEGVEIINDLKNTDNIQLYEQIFDEIIPDINKFHNDDVIKSNASTKNKIKVGNGFIFKDKEYFIIGKSYHYTSLDIKELKLYNNNDKRYCWIKYYKKNYWLCETITKEDYLTFENVKKTNKQRQLTKIDSDYNSFLNYKYDYEFFEKDDNIYINEKNENQDLYFKGEVIKLIKLPIIEYNYKRPEPWEKIENKSVIIKNKFDSETSGKIVSYTIKLSGFILVLLLLNIINIHKYINSIGLIILLIIITGALPSLLYYLILIKPGNKKIEQIEHNIK